MASTTSFSAPTELRRSRRIAGQPPELPMVAIAPAARAVSTIPASPTSLPPRSSSRTSASAQKRKHGKSTAGSEDSNSSVHNNNNVTKKLRRETINNDPPKKEEHEEPLCCSICMSRPGRCQVSTIDSCDHEFCFGCISEWSKKENSCPVCRARFTEISRVHRARGDTRQNSLLVPDRDQEEGDEDSEGTTAAQIVIWGPRHDQEWVFRIPDMPALLGQDEREAFLHHIFHGAMGAAALEQPIAVDVYATSHPPPRRRVQPRRTTIQNSTTEVFNDNRYQVWISSMEFEHEE